MENHKYNTIKASRINYVIQYTLKQSVNFANPSTRSKSSHTASYLLQGNTFNKHGLWLPSIRPYLSKQKYKKYKNCSIIVKKSTQMLLYWYCFCIDFDKKRYTSNNFCKPFHKNWSFIYIPNWCFKIVNLKNCNFIVL